MSDTSQNDHDLAALMTEAIEFLPNGFCILDRNFNPIIANRIAREAFSDFFWSIADGLSCREAHFAEVRRMLSDATDDECWNIVDRLILHVREGKPIDLKARDGRIFRTIYRVMNGGGRVAVYIDITELRRRKSELTALQREADAANHAKSPFLADISHDIRTPLNSIMGMAQVLAHDDLETDYREQLETILESCNTLNTLLEDLLDLSKIEAGFMEIAPVDGNLEQIVHRQHRHWLPRAKEKGIGLKLEIAPGLPARLRFDPVRFGQCVSNLTANAIKLTERGEVQMEITSREVAGKVVVRVTVTDTSIGMSAATADQLFTPFTQADDAISGRFGRAGLGLVVTRKLARLMGGDVQIESTEGEGSTFILTMSAEPARTSQQQTDAAQGTGAKPITAPRDVIRGKRILLVDDHPINRRVARLFLEPAGCQIVEAENGQEALEKLVENTFDLILLDIHMPVLDGVATFRRIRSSPTAWRDIPVIALTADAISGARERYLAEGMNGYVSKPVYKKTLFAQIASLLDQSHSSGSGEALDIAAIASQISRRRPLGSGQSLNIGPVECNGSTYRDSKVVREQRTKWGVIRAEPSTFGLMSQVDPGKLGRASLTPPTAALVGPDVLSMMQDAIEALPHGIAIVDDELRTIVANRIFIETFQDYFAAREKVGTYKEAVFNSIRPAMPDASDEECWRRVDETEAHLRSGAAAHITIPDGRIYRTVYNKMSQAGYVAVSEEITDKCEHEEELEVARRQADAANQAKSAFLANMSREIRTPLHGILNIAQFLVQHSLTPAQSEQATAILESCNALKAVLDDVLDLSKMEAGRMDTAVTGDQSRGVLDRIPLRS